MKKPKITTLENGLTVMTVETDSPSVTVLTLVQAGSKYETHDNNGISHFLEHMCFKGTATQKGKDIMRFLDGLGAETNAFTSQEYTGYYVKSVTKHWKKTLAVVADIFQNPLFPEHEMEKEKGVIIGEINMYQDMPMYHVQDIFESLLYGDQPAGMTILGPEKNIRKMTRNDFVNYHENHYTPRKTTVVIAGDVQHAEVTRQVRTHFAEMKSASAKRKQKTRIKQKRAAFDIQYRATDQTHVVMGYHSFPLDHKDSLTAKVIAGILGGGMSSRLFESLREDLGLGYYVRAANHTYTDTGVLAVSCGVDSKRITEAGKAIQHQIARIRDEGVSEKELKKAVEYLSGNLYMSLESSDALGYFFGKQQVLDSTLMSPQKLTQAMKSITPADIKRVARKIFNKERLNVAILGPHKKPEHQKIKKAFALK